MTGPIVIVMAFDAGYAPHAASAIASIARHASTPDIRFLILQADIDARTRARVEAAAPEAAFEWLTVDLSHFPELAERGHINQTTLYRLGLEKIAPADTSRLIYLDADLTVCADIAELWRYDLDGAPLGAVIDGWIDGEAFAAQWSLAPGGAYFNAGVLLIDLAAVRREALLSKALAFQIEHGAALAFNDQDALNWACWGRWKRLDDAWNTQRQMIIRETVAGGERRTEISRMPARIVHYTTEHKPWLPGAWHPWAWAYWDNLARTSFFAEVAQRYRFGPIARLRAWLRWLRRKPRAA